MNTYSAILYYLNTMFPFPFFFFNENFVHISKKFLVKVTGRLDSKFDQELIELHAFFISNTFISNARLKLAKNQAKAKQHPEA